MDASILTRMDHHCQCNPIGIRPEEDNFAGREDNTADRVLTADYWNFHWLYFVYIIVLITITIPSLIGICSFWAVCPLFIMTFVMFVLIVYCQNRAQQRLYISSDTGSLRIYQRNHIVPLEAKPYIHGAEVSYFIAQLPRNAQALSFSERLRLWLVSFYHKQYNFKSSRQCRSVTSGINNIPPSYDDVIEKSSMKTKTCIVPPSYNDVIASIESQQINI